MSTGRSIPHIRVPALTDGNIIVLDLCQFKGKWVTICCPSRFGLVESLFLDRYRQDWERQGALLVGLVIGAYPFHEPWVRQMTSLGIVLLGDPLGRVGRALKISELSGQSRCQSLIVNPRGIVEYHLVHDLNGRGMSAILEIFQLCKNFQVRLGSYPNQASIDGSFPDCQSFIQHARISSGVIKKSDRNDRKMKKRPHHIDVQEIKENLH